MSFVEETRGRWGPYRSFGKRALDILFVVAAGPVVLPVILMLAVLAKLDGGPAMFRQKRVGLDGRVFDCLKIRTMVVDAEARLEEHLASDQVARAEWEHSQKLRRDPRITRFGRFMRASSLDELPQLWNVLVGDMSLVGPRPFLPEQRAMYPGRAYYSMRPGITGYWQVGDRNDGSFAGRAVHDAAYERDLSLVTDLAILIRTVGVVVRGTGV